MSGKKAPNQPENKPRLQQNFFPGPSTFSDNMGRPPGPSYNPNFHRQTNFLSDRNPSEKMKTWFSKDRFAQESRASSWMCGNKSSTNLRRTSDSEIDSTPGVFWENDLSDEIINQIMNDTFEEKLTQEANAAKLLDASTQQPMSNSTDTLNLMNKSRSENNISVSSNSSSIFPGNRNIPHPLPTSSSASFGSRASACQRKLIKPSKSFNILNVSQSHTTEWLRNQLDKVNKECKALKESLATKDGESKILREKLKDAEVTINKQKVVNEMECTNIKVELEGKIKSLQKELQSAKTQILFKSKEAESNIERYKELKNVTVVKPQFSQASSPSQGFKKFIDRSDKMRSSFESYRVNLLESPQTQKMDISIRPQEVLRPESEKMEVEVIHSPKKKHIRLRAFPKKHKDTLHFGNELDFRISPVIFKKSKPEFSILIPPAIDYYPFDILYRDVSEIPIDDNDDDEAIIYDNLSKHWEVEEETVNVNKPKEKIRSSRFFTSLSPILAEILELCKLRKWDNLPLMNRIIQHVTKMARELYVAFRDPEVFKSSSVHVREKDIHYASWDVSEIDLVFDMFSPEPWKKEIFVDLRRGVALIAALCDIDSGFRTIILKRSDFIKVTTINNEIVSTLELEETNDITCITDTFTNEFVKRTTFVHHRTSEFHSDKVNEILERAEERKKNNPDLVRHIIEESPSKQEIPSRKDLTKNINDISLSCLSKLKSASKINKPKPKTLGQLQEDNGCNLDVKFDILLEILETKIDFSLLKASDPDWKNKVIQKSAGPSKSPDISNEIVMDSLMKKELEKWTDPKSSAPDVHAKLLDKCLSQFEKDLLCRTFNNILQIKNSMEKEGLSIPDKSDERVDEDSAVIQTDPKEVELSEANTGPSKKRKIPADFSEPSTSKGFSSELDGLLKKRDLAPLKKPHLEEDAKEDNMDTQEIQDELEVIYHDERKPAEKDDVLKDQTLPLEIEENQEAMNANRLGTETNKVFPDELAAQYELLEILLEVVRSIGCLRYSISFNAFLAVTVDLLSSLAKTNPCDASLPWVQYICSIMLEILYSRPSPIVLVRIHALMGRCLLIPAFLRIICHNSHPDKYVIRSNKIEFKRGVCLISMLCTLTQLYSSNKNWNIQFNFFNWVSYLFLVERNAVVQIYCRQKTTCGQCSCVQCLDNCIVKLLAKATVSYYSFCFEKKLTPLLKTQLTSIIKQGLRILSVILDIDKLFAQNLSLQYHVFVTLLESIKLLHVSKDFEFVLNEYDLKILDFLREEKVVKHLDKQNARERNLRYVSSSFSNFNFDLKSYALSPVTVSKKY